MVKDIPNIVRTVVGFNKTPDKDGDHLAEVEYELKPMDLDHLRTLFNVDLNDPDPGIQDIIDPLDINQEQANALQPYLVEGEIDLEKYFWELHCNAESEPTPDYTIEDLDNTLDQEDKDKSIKIFNVLLNKANNTEEIIKCYTKMLKLNTDGIREIRILAFACIISDGFPIGDNELFDYLKVGLEDPVEYIRDEGKRIVRLLKDRNNKLYQRIKSQYNLQYSHECDEDYEADA